MSGIQWTDETWNPVTGCTRVSAGCQNCYAEREANRLAGNFPRYKGLTKKVGDEVRWTGEVRFVEEALDLPLRWKAPRRIFVNSMSDLFHPKVSDGWIMRILNVMARTPRHTYQILTKRPERMRSFFTRWADLSGEDFGEFKDARGPEPTRRAHPSPRGQLFADMLEAMGTPPKGCAYPTFDWMEGMIRWPAWFDNIWLGVSVEDQPTADERIPTLLATPAAVRWVSYEPALEPVDFRRWVFDRARAVRQAVNGPMKLNPDQADSMIEHPIDWIVVGGESGPGARPFDLAWARATIAQCRAAGVKVFVKQLGAHPFASVLRDTGDNWPGPIEWSGDGLGTYRPRLRDRKGGSPEEWPKDLRVREYPKGA